MVFRCTIFFLEKDPAFASLRPSNIFLRADSQDGVKEKVEEFFRALCVKRGIPDAKFRVEVSTSSEEEIEQYAAMRQAGFDTNRVLN